MATLGWVVWPWQPVSQCKCLQQRLWAGCPSRHVHLCREDTAGHALQCIEKGPEYVDKASVANSVAIIEGLFA